MFCWKSTFKSRQNAPRLRVIKNQLIARTKHVLQIRTYERWYVTRQTPQCRNVIHHWLKLTYMHCALWTVKHGSVIQQAEVHVCVCVCVYDAVLHSVVPAVLALILKNTVYIKTIINWRTVYLRDQKLMLIHRPDGRRRLGIPFEETIRRGRNGSVKA